MRHCYDASRPSKNPPNWWISGFYIAGMTPHIWTGQEIADDKARFGLPISVWVGADDRAEAIALGHQILDWIDAHRVPKGVTVVIDTETRLYTVFLLTLDQMIHGAGWSLMNYGSVSTIVHNPLLSGGRWTADWTDTPHLDNVPGEKGTQYANGLMLHADYDASVFEDSVPLWEKNPPHRPPVVSWEEVVLNKVGYALTELDAASRIIKSHVPQ